jgi:hypothetical protein
MEAKRINKINLLILLLGLLVLSSCCSTAYTPPQVQHTYTTSTQGPRRHAVSGLNITYEDEMKGDAAISTLIGAVLLSAEKIEFFIDGRLVASGLRSQGIKTFVQLPPGEHELHWQFTLQGATTLGEKSAYHKQTYQFELAEGQKGKFKVRLFRDSSPATYDKPNAWKLGTDIAFENVEAWKEFSDND